MTDRRDGGINSLKAVCSTNRVPLVAAGGFFLFIGRLCLAL
jgi:hypothetical protein